MALGMAFSVRRLAKSSTMGSVLASFRRKASSARRSWNGVGWVEYAHTFRSDNGYGGRHFLSDGRKARAADQNQIYFRLNQIGGHF
jgi:hypothetical protein